MPRHVGLTIKHRLPVYFCDLQCPWQRGANENTKGHLHRYFPKGTDLNLHGPEELEAVAAALKGRPGRTLRWATPAETLDEVLKSAETGNVAATALGALIAMVDDVAWFSVADRHVHGVHCPAGDCAAICRERHLQPTLMASSASSA